MGNDSPLTTIQIRQGPFAPPELPDFHATMNPSDSRTDPVAVIDSPHELMPKASSVRVSQVPRLIFRRPPSSVTPESPTTALARCFMVDAGFTIVGRLATLDLCHEAESGSLALRLTPSPQRGFVSPGRPGQRPLDYMAHEHLP